MPIIPPPLRETKFDSTIWKRWFIDLQKFLADTAGLIPWVNISKTGANLTDLPTRNHNDTQNKQGGSGTEFYHLTSAQHTDLTDGGDSTSHYHATDRARANHTGTQALATISDVTMTAANLNTLDDGADSSLHFHASDRARASHTGTQNLSTIGDVTMTAANLNSLDDGANTTLHYHASDRARANHTGAQPSSTITGTTTNDDAGAGDLGEYATGQRTSGSAVSLTNTTAADITSVSLTAGDWDVTGVVDYVTTGATTSDIKSGISTTSATFGAQDTFANWPLIATALSDTAAQVCPTVRVSLAATTTVYLVGQANFAAGTVGGYGTIRARRVR